MKLIVQQNKPMLIAVIKMLAKSVEMQPTEALKLTLLSVNVKMVVTNVMHQDLLALMIVVETRFFVVVLLI